MPSLEPHAPLPERPRRRGARAAVTLVVLAAIGWAFYASSEHFRVGGKISAGPGAQRTQEPRAGDAEPPEVAAATERAGLLERAGDLARCAAVLEPFRAQLGAGEGARILGQIDAREGRVDEAIALLSRYTNDRLARLAATERAYDKALKAASHRALDAIKRGAAPGFDYRAYKRGGPAEQETLVRLYRDSRLKQDAALGQLEAQRARDAQVVPAALELGILLLRRARQQVDPAARRAGLEAAERTLLAIRGRAGRSHEYRLNLGQVYYWLGRHAEGRRLFDELLRANDHDARTLAQVSRALHAVGAGGEARSLAETLYARTTDRVEKQAIAQQLGASATDDDDRVRWLERADPGNPSAQAMLADSRGRRAAVEGDDAEAVRQLRRAVALYEALNQDASTLNNGALARFELSALTGDRAQHDQALAMIERALALDPGNSVLVGNAARRILEGGLRDVIGDSLDLRALRRDASVELLDFLYNDPSGREALRARIRTHPRILRAQALFEQAWLLAPKRGDAYAALLPLAIFLRDESRLRDLAAALDRATPDQQHEARRALEFYAGRADGRYRRELTAALALAEVAYREAKAGPRGTTRAVAAAHAAACRMLACRVGQPADPDTIVSLADDAHAGAPSPGTRCVLVAALLHRAARSAAARDPEFATWVDRSRRELDPAAVLIARMDRGNAARSTALDHPDVRRAIVLLQNDAVVFPETLASSDWAVLAAAAPEQSATATRVLGTELSRLADALRARLRPWDLALALDRWWAARLLRRPGEDAAALELCAGRGLPLPFDPRDE